MYKIEIKGPIVSNTVGWLYHYLGWDACCPKDVIDGLEKANGDDVVLEINSGGGVCIYGYEMYTASSLSALSFSSIEKRASSSGSEFKPYIVSPCSKSL